MLRGMIVLETSWVAGLSYRANHEVNNCFETWPGKGRSFINEVQRATNEWLSRLDLMFSICQIQISVAINFEISSALVSPFLSVNVTKFAENCWFGHIYWRNSYGKSLRKISFSCGDKFEKDLCSFEARQQVLLVFHLSCYWVAWTKILTEKWSIYYKGIKVAFLCFYENW